MSEDDDFLIIGDRRHEDNMAGAIEIKMDYDLSIIHTGAGDFTELVILKEETAKDIYNKLDNLFGGDDNQ